jgi:hypothetical protein
LLSVELRRCALGALMALGLASVFGAAGADPVSVQKGKTVLPMSGLVVDLPARSRDHYNVSGSWSVTDKGIFDSRDIIDEMDSTTNQVVAGNWVLIGYFDAGDCDAVLRNESLDSSWTTEETFWGVSWKVRGGVYTFTNSLGRRPAAVLCSQDAETTRTFLLYRFLTSQPETLDQKAILADVRTSEVLQTANAAYRNGQTQDIKPLTRPETRNRGTVSAARTVSLPITQLDIDLPDDGFVWLANAGDGSDMLDRMVPFMPEMSVEVARIEDATCDDIFAYGLPTEGRISQSATNLPAGWKTAPGMKVEANNELILCHGRGDAALMIGVIQSSTQTDVAALWPLLAAVAAARDTP